MKKAKLVNPVDFCKKYFLDL